MSCPAAVGAAARCGACLHGAERVRDSRSSCLASRGFRARLYHEAQPASHPEPQRAKDPWLQPAAVERRDATCSLDVGVTVTLPASIFVSCGQLGKGRADLDWLFGGTLFDRSGKKPTVFLRYRFFYVFTSTIMMNIGVFLFFLFQ